MMNKRPSLSSLLRLVLVVICLWGVHVLLQEVHLQEILHSLANLARWKIGLALLCVIGSYIALALYDVLGCRYAQAQVPLLAIAGTAVLANAISNTVGFALLSGSAVRLRCYSALGVSGGAVFKISLFCTATFLLGLMLAASLGLVFDSHVFGAFTGAGEAVTQLIGLGGLTFCLLLPVFVGKKKVIHWHGEEIALPSPTLMWGQYMVGLADILATGAVAYLLLPDGNPFGFLAFISLFSIALWLGLISHMPGGLGVFEAVMLAGLGSEISSGSLLAALLLYRLLYYALPFVMATIVIATVEGGYLLKRAKIDLSKPARVLLGLVRMVLPTLLAGMTALAGIVLLISGAMPATHGRIEWLIRYLPMAFIEGSHLLSSIIGFAMLFTARGIYNRYDSAYPAALLLLVGGIAFSLIKGFDYEEAVVLAMILPFVAISRRVFYRPSRISMMELNFGWWLFISATLAGIVWLVSFAYKHVDYDHYLWWQIALGVEGDASRSLRSTLVILAFALGIGINQLFHSAKAVFTAPTKEDLLAARRIMGKNSSTNSFLALTGDKYLLFAADQDAFIMFGQTPRSLVAMGDPVGNPASFASLIWRLHDLADRYQRRLSFYQISTDYLPYYIDSGMQFARLGEEALLEFRDFTLQGSRYKQIRQSLSKGEREQLSFSLLPIAEVPAVEQELHAISEQWLAHRKVREKTFSLGSYSRFYIEQFPVAVVHWQGRLVAFANVWATDNGQEFSVDLMRHSGDAPPGTMDYLFAKLLLWGKEQGFAYFNLGMAPMAGFSSHRLAPIWTKWGAFVYAHGERFYNFQGLYAFKSKYHPIWRPRYLAYTGGSVFSNLVDVAILIAGGIRGLFKK